MDQAILGKLFGTFSELFVNLSAGWFGAAIIVPILTKRSKLDRALLIGNITCGILALILSFLLKLL